MESNRKGSNTILIFLDFRQGLKFQKFKKKDLFLVSFHKEFHDAQCTQSISHGSTGRKNCHCVRDTKTAGSHSFEPVTQKL